MAQILTRVSICTKPCVYILLCDNGSYYVGSTTNLRLRLQEHEEGLGSNHTKGHHPIELVYTEEYETPREAHMRERQLHKWSHAKKQALINGDIGRLRELSKSTCPEFVDLP